MEASGTLESMKHGAAIFPLLRYLLDVTQLTIYFKRTEVLQRKRWKQISVAIILHVSRLTCCGPCETAVRLLRSGPKQIC